VTELESGCGVPDGTHDTEMAIAGPSPLRLPVPGTTAAEDQAPFFSLVRERRLLSAVFG
jgi:hypothetical protein